MNIEVKHELRPCKIGGKNYLFHCFEQWEQQGKEFNAQVFALVEDTNGNISRVDPIEIKFIDNKHSEYCWDFADDKWISVYGKGR